MRKEGKGLIIVGLCLLAGCVAIYPEVDQRYGEATASARSAQTLNPHAAREPRPVSGIDGPAAKETIDRYLNSFKAPPPTTNVLNIGGGLATGQ
jgi:hypothetical protein